MNVSKTLVSTAAAMAIAGVVGFAYAQTNQQNINVKPKSNLTQTQSDAALPCQPTPFNPHLPADAGKRGNSTTSNYSADCATPVVYSEVRTVTPVIVQTETPVVYQSAPATTVVTEPTQVYVAASDTTPRFEERMPREDRN